MNLLAEANRAAPGRWVLMPRRGQRFMGPERQRARVRRRRRQVFMVLLESTGFTLIMGVFPPFRIMLWVTAVLVFVLLAYMAALVRLHAEEVDRDRMYTMARYRAEYGNGNGNGHGNGYRYGYGYATRSATSGKGNGDGHRGVDGADWLESGVRIVDDDCHVIVYRSDEIDTSSLTSA
ncbi:MAG: hypothetical protein ACRDHO_16165 [Actinomycetota bacterium]